MIDPLLLEAMREVDAMLPHTPPIAPREEFVFAPPPAAMWHVFDQIRADANRLLASRVVEVECDMKDLPRLFSVNEVCVRTDCNPYQAQPHTAASCLARMRKP